MRTPLLGAAESSGALGISPASKGISRTGARLSCGCDKDRANDQTAAAISASTPGNRLIGVLVEGCVYRIVSQEEEERNLRISQNPLCFSIIKQEPLAALCLKHSRCRN